MAFLKTLLPKLPFIGYEIGHRIHIRWTFHFVNNGLIRTSRIIVINMLIFNAEHFRLTSNEQQNDEVP